jgi:hypothetical protein
LFFCFVFLAHRAWKLVNSVVDSSSPVKVTFNGVLNKDFFTFAFHASKGLLNFNQEQQQTALFNLANYSLKQLRPLLKSVMMDQTAKGTLQLCNSAECMKTLTAMEKTMTQLGCPFELVQETRARAIAVPLTKTPNSVLGGAFSSADLSGDVFKFAKFLSNLATKAGVKFEYGAKVSFCSCFSSCVTSSLWQICKM